MKYEVIQQGSHWIATDGNHVVEGEDAADALTKLELVRLGHDAHVLDQQVSRGQVKHMLCLAAIRLIQLITLHSPASILREAAANISKKVELLIELEEE